MLGNFFQNIQNTFVQNVFPPTSRTTTECEVPSEGGTTSSCPTWGRETMGPEQAVRYYTGQTQVSNLSFGGEMDKLDFNGGGL